MSTEWFAPARNDRWGISEKGEFNISIPERPKGLRINTRLARRLLADGVSQVLIGKSEETLVIKAASEGDTNAFRVTAKGKSAQITSIALHAWAVGVGLVGKQLFGNWNDETQQFEFFFGQDK